MHSTKAPAAVCAALTMVSAGPLLAQRGGDWMTIGNDVQRSSWLRSDVKISGASMRKPGFQLVWKVKLKNADRPGTALTPPALLDFYIGYRGFRSLGFVGSGSGTITGIDTDLARIEWEKDLAPAPGGPASAAPCPGGMTSSVTRPASTAYPSATTPRGFGRGGPAKSGAGEPFEGALTLREPPFRLPAPTPPQTKQGRRTAPAPNPFARGPQYVHAVAAGGTLHSLYVSNGEEPNPPVRFLPPNANALGLMVFDNVAYVATANGCGGVEDGVWALDLKSKGVTRWRSSRSPAGSTGFAAGPDGTLYVAHGSELTALDPDTLKRKASYKAGTEVFTSSPVVFEFKGKDLIAVTTSEGRLHLLDAAALGGKPLHATAPYSSRESSPGTPASWQDEGGTRWVLAAASGVRTAGFASNGEVSNGAIAAWKVVERGGAIQLEPGWVSRDMISPLAPVIVNGVVFALSSGESAGRSSPAVLYALDAATGKELWNSGTTITTFVRGGGLAAGGSKVYVGASDGTQYAFGFPLEI